MFPPGSQTQTHNHLRGHSLTQRPWTFTVQMDKLYKLITTYLGIVLYLLDLLRVFSAPGLEVTQSYDSMLCLMVCSI